MIARLVSLLVLLLPLTAASAAPEPPAAGSSGVFVLGIDGMDPVILQRLMDEGRMPHFARLAGDGSFQQLGTSYPPQSPVAWSNFVTGMNPGGHGIYDFIHRDPKTYTPISSATPPPSGEEPVTLELFGLIMPIAGGDEIVNNRSGTPFWDYLHDAGVDVEVYRMPGNFPPTPSEAMTLSGMGTDDLRALNGKYFWYTDEFIGGASRLKAEYTLVTPEDEDGDGFAETVRTTLKGPADAMRADPVSEWIELEMTVHIDPEFDTAWIQVGGADVIVDQGSWSDWVDVSFDGGLATLTGMVRFYAKELRPGFKLYVSPINFSPAAPATPITTPGDASLQLFEELGPFYTQGMPEETNAFKDGLFDDDDFIKQVKLVHEDGYAMLDLAMQRFEPGDMTFMYLSDIDLQCHMLWHHADPKTPGAPDHPARKSDDDGRYDSVLEEFYEGVDVVLGHVRETLPEDTLLVVISDHGFQSYTRKLHLNAWLRDEGYLVLKDGATTGAVATGEVDWSKTRAYALGFNGVYLNRAGREGQGIVADAEVPNLKAELIEKLNALRDPDNGQRVVLAAVDADQVYTGARASEAPDIVVGFDAGYGNSEQSTLGEVTQEVFEDNTGGDFTGNHLMAPDVVPGVLLTNRPIPTTGSDLTDITATLLDYYGLDVPADMVGRSILQND